MKISEVAIKGAESAYWVCNREDNLDACGYTFKRSWLFGLLTGLDSIIRYKSFRWKESGFKVELFCVFLGFFLKPFYNHFLEKEDATKADYLLMYIWRHFPKAKNEVFVGQSTPTVRLCMNTREYMFNTGLYDNDKLSSFLRDTIWYIDEGRISLDSSRAQNINDMIEAIRKYAEVEARIIMKHNSIVDDIGFTTATSETLDLG